MYAAKACSLRTGRVVADLPLVNISAQRRLDPGQFSAGLKLPAAAPAGQQRALDLAKCRTLINATTPAVMTVLILRNGMILGEWLLWSRDRSQRPISLSGLEIRSWFDHAAVDGFTTMTNVDEMVLAKALVDNALAKPFAPPMTVETPPVSGNVIATAEYPTGSDYVGNILNELGGALDGFDWWVDTEWDNTALLPTVKRTVRFNHPRRGRLLQERIDVPARAPGQSGVSFGLTEDAAKVATTVYMSGTGEDDAQLVARGQNNDLYVSYPSLDLIDSRASYDIQELLDAQAAAVAAVSRSPELPATLRLRADGSMPLGTYQPGDSLPVVVEPWENFPDGFNETVRIVGYTITPPAGGATDNVDVEIERDDTSALSA